jgi:hypothetical protein
MIIAKHVFLLQLRSLCITINIIRFLQFSITSTTIDAYCFKSISPTKFCRTDSKRRVINQESTYPVYASSTTPEEQPIVDDGNWKGDVVPGGTIRGCKIQQVDGILTEWIITIDGVEADLGRFSEAIYKKVTADAKRQTFQGFRPGTIPPHLEPTYRAFTMDECARETVLEAMTQNNIRPFESTRSEFLFLKFSIPPPKSNKKKKNSSSNKKHAKQAKNSVDDNDMTTTSTSGWLEFDTMKEAIDAGWRPGQSFSFFAEKCKGQKVRDQSEITGSTPLGLTY